MSVVSDVEIRLRADIARLQQDMTAARRSVDTALNGMSASAQALKGVLGGIAAGLSVGAFTSFIKNSIDAADALNDMSARTKVAIEDLAGLAYAAKLGDTSLDGVAASISKLGQNIGKDGAKFRELGITATEPLEAFKQLADVFKDIKDPQQRAAFGAEALGKSWQEAAVLLDGGAAGITALMDRGKELSGVTEQVAADAGKFNDGLDTLGFTAQGVGTRIAAGLLPMLNVLVDDFTATGKGADKAASAVTVLSGAFKALYAVGVVVVEMFTTLGKAAGAAAAITVAALSGDFKGAVTIYKELASDVADGWVDGAKKIANAWAATGATVAKEGEAASTTAAATAAKVAGFLNSGEIAGARDKAAAKTEAAVAKEKAAYAGLIASIKEKMAADQMEILGGEALTVAAKSRIKLDQELAAGKIVLTEAHVAEAHALLDVADTLEKSAKGLAAYKAMQKALTEQTEKAVQAATDEADKNEELAKTFGMTKVAIEQLELARLQDQLAQRASTGLTLDEIDALEKLIEAKKRSAAAVGTIDALEKQKKATDAAAASQIAFWKSIDDTAHDTFVSIANGSKDTAQRLKDTFKNVFFDWLYQQTIKKWIINVGTSTSSAGGVVDGISSLFGSSGAASGGNSAGGILGSASNLLSIGKTIYAGFTTGLTATIGSSITSLGTMIGSEAVAAFGAGISGGALGATTASAASGYAGTAAASAGAGAAGAIPVIGWIITAMMTANGLYKQGWDATNGTLSETGKVLGSGVLALNSVLKKFGLSDSAANIFSGQATISKLFGRKNPEIESQGLRGTLTATGLTGGENYVNILEKGGWFRSDKRTSKVAAASSETDKLFDDTLMAMSTAVKTFGKAMGLETAAIDTYSKVLDLKLTGKAEEDNATVAKLFGDIGDELSLRLVPGLAAFAKEGETMSATLQRLAVDYQSVDAILTATGQSIKLIGVAGIEARENLIKAAGGLEALTSGVSFFQQNFLTAAQQLAPAQKQVADALAAMGMSAVKTTEQFAAATLGIDLNTQAGAELYVKMLALAPAFKTVTDATKAQADAAQAAARAAQELAAAKAAEELQRIADAAKALSGAVDGALAGLSRSVQAQRDANEKVFDTLMKSLGASIETVTGKIAGIKAVADQLRTGVATSGTGAAASARAALSAAAVEAQRSGLLPDPEALRGILETVRRDNADQYGSMIEYQRAAAAANRDIETLAGAADTELSLAQKTLTTLQDQRAAAQFAYDSENMRLDGIIAQGQATVDRLNGIYGGVMAIPDAIAALAASIKAAMANPVAASGGAAQSAYQTYLGRTGTEAEIAFWKEQAARGVDVKAAIAGSDEAKIQALYQKYLGRTGEAAGVDLWEAARAAGRTWADIEAGFAGSDEAKGRTRVDPAIEMLTAQMAGMQTSMARTAAATTKLAEQFDQVSGGGNVLYTETA